MSRGYGCTIFIGNLPGDVREREVEDLFHKYGRILALDLKTPPRPPAYAFVEYEDPRDAQDAVQGRDNYDFHGNRLRVEISHGRARGERGAFGGYRGGHSGRSAPNWGSAMEILERSRSKGSAYRALVKGLPASASWQDLKDHFRKVVKPSYTNVVRDRSGAVGIVEFETADDLDRAIRKLDDTEFRNPFDRGYIRIQEDDGAGRGRGRSRSRSRGRSYSRSRSRSRSRSYSRSRSRSRSKSKSGSRSRSYSKSKSRSRSRSVKSGKSKSRSPSRSASPIKPDDPPQD